MSRLTIATTCETLAKIPYANYRLQRSEMVGGYVVRSSVGCVCYSASNLKKVETWAKMQEDWYNLRDTSEDDTFRYMTDRTWYKSPLLDEAIKYLYLYEVDGEFMNSLKSQVLAFFNNPDSVYNKPLSEKQAQAALRSIPI